MDLDLLDREEALRRHWHKDTNPKPRAKRHKTSAYRDKSPRRTFNRGFLFHFKKVPLRRKGAGDEMRRAARPATVVMGAKLVQVRGTDSTDMQPGLSAHSRDKDRRWQGKGFQVIRKWNIRFGEIVQ